MTISELIKELEKWKKIRGDVKVEVIHSGYYGYHEVMDVTVADNRTCLFIVTMPAEWWEEEMKIAKETFDRYKKEGEAP